MRKIIKAVLGVVMMLSLLWTNNSDALATGVTEIVKPYIIVESYQVSEGRIIPGEKFTLTLNLKNSSEIATATDVLIDIENPYGVAPVYGTVSQKYIGNIEPAQSVQVSFEYDAWETITNNTLDFSVAIIAEQRTNYVMLRVPAGADNPFNVLELTIPERVIATEMTSLSLSYRVVGKSNVNNVLFQVVSNGEVLGSSTGGNITVGATKNQNISVNFPGAGEYVLDFYMKYQAEDGTQESVLIDSRVINVEPKNLSLDGYGQTGIPQEEQPDNTRIMILILGGVLILTIFVVIAIIMKKKR